MWNMVYPRLLTIGSKSLESLLSTENKGSMIRIGKVGNLEKPSNTIFVACGSFGRPFLFLKVASKDSRKRLCLDDVGT